MPKQMQAITIKESTDLSEFWAHSHKKWTCISRYWNLYRYGLPVSLKVSKTPRKTPNQQLYSKKWRLRKISSSRLSATSERSEMSAMRTWRSTRDSIRSGSSTNSTKLQWEYPKIDDPPCNSDSSWIRPPAQANYGNQWFLMTQR